MVRDAGALEPERFSQKGQSGNWIFHDLVTWINLPNISVDFTAQLVSGMLIL